MKQVQETGKRIVSRTSLVGMQIGLHTLTGVLGLAAVCCAFVGILCFALAFGFSVLLVLVEGNWREALKWLGGLLLAAGLLAPIAYLTGRGARASHKKVGELQSLMVVNTADLPASESLVRASSEPVQEQKAVLLRAATQGTETPPEELVRAVAGPRSDAL